MGVAVLLPRIADPSGLALARLALAGFGV
jgi:hypothetical protein